MKIAVCEDHGEEALWLEKMIKKWAAKRRLPVSVTIFADAEQFWFSYEPGVSFDVLFLDIQMPGESGLVLAKKLREKGDAVPLIFVTGIDDFVSEGYDVQAVHYLVKPVKEEKIGECLDRVCQNMEQAEPFLLLETEQGTVKLLQKDILKVEIFAHRCVYTTLQKEYAVSQSLKDAEEGLASDWFVHSHRSILVNLYHIEAITRQRVFLTGGHEALVSRRLYMELNRAFISFYADTKQSHG